MISASGSTSFYYCTNTKMQDTESFLTRLTFEGTCRVVLKNISRTCEFISKSSVKSRRQIPRQFSLNHLHLFCRLLFLSFLLPFSMSFPQYGTGSFEISSFSSTTDLPHWVNPCNGNSTTSKYSEENNSGPDVVFITAAKLTAQQARYQAEKFRERYVLKTFRESMRNVHRRWKSKKYEWLLKDMKIPKDLGDMVSQKHLKSLSLEDELLKIYGYLQRLAVALEQLVLDHHQDSLDFREEFAIAENNMKEILCEIRELIQEDKLEGFENAERSIMDGFRHMNFTSRHLRDWLIFRDYMNLVEYIEQVMTYFEKEISY